MHSALHVFLEAAHCSCHQSHLSPNNTYNWSNARLPLAIPKAGAAQYQPRLSNLNPHAPRPHPLDAHETQMVDENFARSW